MSAFRYLAYVLSIPLAAIMLTIGYEITTPSVDLLYDLSDSQASATGISWYEMYLDLLPLIVLALLGFALVVTIINRRRSVVR